MTLIAAKVETSMINSDHGSTAPKARGEKIIAKRNSLNGILDKVCSPFPNPIYRKKSRGEQSLKPQSVLGGRFWTLFIC
jgi:hypothetical protein